MESSLTTKEEDEQSEEHGRSEEQLAVLKQTLTDQFEQLTRQIHNEAQNDQVIYIGSVHLLNRNPHIRTCALPPIRPPPYTSGFQYVRALN